MEFALPMIFPFQGDQTDEVLCNLQMIFISHQHSDHHLGRILKKILQQSNFLSANCE